MQALTALQLSASLGTHSCTSLRIFLLSHAQSVICVRICEAREKGYCWRNTEQSQRNEKIHTTTTYLIVLDELRAGGSVNEGAQLAGHDLVLRHEALYSGCVLLRD